MTRRRSAPERASMAEALSEFNRRETLIRGGNGSGLLLKQGRVLAR